MPLFQTTEQSETLLNRHPLLFHLSAPYLPSLSPTWTTLTPKVSLCWYCLTMAPKGYPMRHSIAASPPAVAQIRSISQRESQGRSGKVAGRKREKKIDQNRIGKIRHGAMVPLDACRRGKSGIWRRDKERASFLGRTRTALLVMACCSSCLDGDSWVGPLIGRAASDCGDPCSERSPSPPHPGPRAWQGRHRPPPEEASASTAETVGHR